MATIFDSRLSTKLSEYKGEYEWHLNMNGLRKEDFSMTDFLKECVSDETKLMFHTLDVMCGKIIVIFKTDKNLSCKILKSGRAGEIMDTINGKEATLYTDIADLRACIYNTDGTHTDVTYRFIKDGKEDSVDFKRVLAKIGRNEEYSQYDLSRTTSSVKPILKGVFD